MIQNVVKGIFTTIIGLALMTFAIGCYYFDFPRDASPLSNAIEGGIGFILLFVDENKIANVLFGAFKKKINRE